MHLCEVSVEGYGGVPSRIPAVLSVFSIRCLREVVNEGVKVTGVQGGEGGSESG